MTTTKTGIPRCDSCESSASCDTDSSVSTSTSTSNRSNEYNKESCAYFFNIAVNYCRNCMLETPRKNNKSNESITKSVTSNDSDYIHSISSDENIQNLCIDYEKKIKKSKK